jgi:hypothetical protein
MKKYRKSIILLITLALVAAFFLIRSSRGSFSNKSNLFAVSDTSTITKFFLADKMNNTVKVDRSANGTWVLNDKYEVNPTMVKVMLKTFKGIEIKAPVSKSTRNTIIRSMAGKSIKTEIYQRVYRINLFNRIKLFPHEKLTRTYYVGDATMDNSGTFMLMEGTEEPYIVNIPGFRGFVSTRYSASEADWRGHSVFKFRIPDISSISVKFNEMPEKSYRITNLDNRSFTLVSVIDNRTIQLFDTTKVVGYLSLFRNLNFESILDDMTRTKRDSITETTPTNEIILMDKLGKEHTLKTWKRKADAGQLDSEGRQLEWDNERIYGLADNSEYLVTLQYFVFGDVLAPLQWFTTTDIRNQ